MADPGPSALLRASDDVLIMVLEKTSAVDVAQMLRVNKELYQRLSGNINRIACSLVKVQDDRLGHHGAYLDFTTLDVAHAVERYVKFFKIDGKRAWEHLEQPKWYDIFMQLYGFYFASKSLEHRCALREAQATYILNIFLQLLHALQEATDQDLQPLIDSEGFMHWYERLALSPANVDGDAYKDMLIYMLCQKPGHDRDHLRRLFSYVEEADVFGAGTGTAKAKKDQAPSHNGSIPSEARDSNQVCGDSLAANPKQEASQHRDDEAENDGRVTNDDASKLLRELSPSPTSRVMGSQEWLDSHIHHHMLIMNTEGVSAAGFTEDVLKPLTYYSMSGRKGLSAAAERAERARKNEKTEPSQLLLAAVMEDAGVCHVYHEVK